MKNLDMDLSTLLDKYLLGELSQAEKKQWEQVQQQEVWQKELALRRDLILAAKSLGREQLKAEFQALEKDQSKVRSLAPKRRFGTRFVLAIAAIFALLLLVWISFPSKEINHQELFAANFEAYPNHLVMITRDTGLANSPLERTFAAYEQGQYEMVVESLENTAISDSLSLSEAQRRFYLGVSLLGMGQAQAAISEFSWFEKDQGQLLRNPAEWYIALGHLKMNQLNQARNQLKKIANQSDHPFQLDAVDLLEEL